MANHQAIHTSICSNDLLLVATLIYATLTLVIDGDVCLFVCFSCWPQKTSVGCTWPHLNQ